MKAKELGIFTAIYVYSNMSYNIELNEPILIRLRCEIERVYRKLNPSKQTARNSQVYFDKIKTIDHKLFQDKEFSPVVMVLLLMQYLKSELRDLTIRNKFTLFDFDKMIEELETCSLREDIFSHHKVVHEITKI